MGWSFGRISGVTVELVLIDLNKIAESLNTGQCDIIMSGLVTTTERVQTMALSGSYMNTTMAFIVRDHWRDEFSRWETIQQLETPRIGVPNLHYFASVIRERLPNAKLVPLNSVRDYFRTEWEILDAFALGAETSSAWTLVYPQFQVTVPLPNPVSIPLAYAMPRGEHGLVDFVYTWIDLKKKDHTIDALFEHWILGKHALQKGPRWSVIRDVLHWVE